MMSFIFGLILILIGISVFIGFWLFKFAVSILIIAIGIRVIMRGDRNHRYYNWGKETFSSEDYINEVAIFSPINKTIKSEKLRGGKVVMIFSGGQIDLRHAKTEGKEINMELVAVFGGLKLHIPKEWKVNLQGTAIFGAYDNKTSEANGEIILNLKGSVVFGGIEILN